MNFKDYRKTVKLWRKIRSTARPAREFPDDFWIRQKAAIMAGLPSRQRMTHSLWRIVAPVAAALVIGLGTWRHIYRSHQEQLVLVQDAEMIQNLDLLNDLDWLEDWNGKDRA